jgi:hypothetical protein
VISQGCHIAKLLALNHMILLILLIATSNFDDGTDYHYDAVHLPEWTTQYTI